MFSLFHASRATVLPLIASYRFAIITFLLTNAEKCVQLHLRTKNVYFASLVWFLPCSRLINILKSLALFEDREKERRETVDLSLRTVTNEQSIRRNSFTLNSKKPPIFFVCVVKLSVALETAPDQDLRSLQPIGEWLVEQPEGEYFHTS